MCSIEYDNTMRSVRDYLVELQCAVYDCITARIKTGLYDLKADILQPNIVPKVLPTIKLWIACSKS